MTDRAVRISAIAMAGCVLSAISAPTISYGFDVDLTNLETLQALGVKTIAEIPIGKTGFLSFAYFGFCNHDGQAYVNATAEVTEASGGATLNKILIMRRSDREVTIDLLPGSKPEDRQALLPILKSTARIDCAMATLDHSMDGFYAVTTISGHTSLSEAIKEVIPPK